MCGIWGYVTGETTKGASQRRAFLEQAATVGVLRGGDGTGAFFVPHEENGAADWCKLGGTGMEFLACDHAQTRLALPKINTYRAVIGHNRSATRGTVNTDNAHPFQEGAITLVHNGTLHYTGNMKVQAGEVSGKKGRVEVDSHLICHNLAAHSIEDVAPTLLGAFALVWHDGRTGAVHLLRNSERPLHLMKVKCEDTVLIASEADMLWWLAGRCGFARDAVYALTPSTLLTFEAGNIKPTARHISLVPARSAYSSSYSSSYSGDWQRGQSAGKGPAPAIPDRRGTWSTSRKGVEMLREFGLTPNSELDFTVDTVLPQKNGRVTVNGWAYFPTAGGNTEAMQAVLHGVAEELATRSQKDDWTVRPVAVWRIGETGVPCLVCRLVKVSPVPSKQSSGSDKVPGPSGMRVSRTDWMLMTTGGCIECGKALTLREAEDIVWTESGRPLCMACADRWTEPHPLVAVN